MIEVLNAPDKVWAVKLSGEVSATDVGSAYDALAPKLKANKSMGVVVDVGSVGDASRDAINADVKHELSLLGNLPQFKRMALLTDKKWISYLFERLDPIIPSMKMKIFAPGEVKAAVDWAAAS